MNCVLPDRNRRRPALHRFLRRHPGGRHARLCRGACFHARGTRKKISREEPADRTSCSKCPTVDASMDSLDKGIIVQPPFRKIHLPSHSDGPERLPNILTWLFQSHGLKEWEKSVMAPHMPMRFPASSRLARSAISSKWEFASCQSRRMKPSPSPVVPSFPITTNESMYVFQSSLLFDSLPVCFKCFLFCSTRPRRRFDGGRI